MGVGEMGVGKTGVGEMGIPLQDGIFECFWIIAFTLDKLGKYLADFNFSRISTYREIPRKLDAKIFHFTVWAWRPSWSCDPDAVNKISFPLPKEAPHKIGYDRASSFGEEDV